jgi:hypothetical protein
MSSIANIVSNASANLSFYHSFVVKDKYYEKCVDSSILITSLVEDKLEEIVNIDGEISFTFQLIKDNDKNIKELKEKLSTKTSFIENLINLHSIKLERKERRDYFNRIQYLNHCKNELIQELQPNKYVEEHTSFSTNITIMESNKLRGILRNEKKQSYLMNMTNESRNKRKNSREMNKLLFGKEKSSNKHNKIRKTHSPNNKLYY